MPLTRLTLRLARNPGTEFPDGDDQRGYVVVAPLDKFDKLDVDLWRAHKKDCTVIRFSPDESERADGWITHRDSKWYFRYDEDEEGPNEPIYRLGKHEMWLNDYLTIHEAGKCDFVFKITDALPLAGED